jgi:hypothetical protein
MAEVRKMERRVPIVGSHIGGRESDAGTISTWVDEPREGPSLEAAIAAWLHSKKGLSESVMTVRAYEQAITSFRRTCHENGIDLDGQVDVVAAVAQVWCRRRFDGRGESASAGTINQRLAALSSFYTFAERRRLLFGQNPARENPIALVALSTGRRRAELGALTRGDLVLSGDYVLVTW